MLTPSPSVSAIVPAGSLSPAFPIPRLKTKMPRPVPLPHPMMPRHKTGTIQPKSFALSVTQSSNCSNSLEPAPTQQALTDPHWKSAVDSEYTALMKKGTWSLVPSSPSMHVVANKPVFRVKYKANGSFERHKARLVAKGFQQQAGLDFVETFSPVVKPSTIGVVFTLAVTFNSAIQQVDVNNAFLNGELQEF